MRPYLENRQNRKNTYRLRLGKPITFVTLLCLLSIILFVGFSLMSINASDRRMRSRELTEALLCNTKVPCNIILTAKSNKEPIEIQFVSPSGTIYREKDMDNTIRSKNGLDVTMSLFTGETGEWKMRYNQLTNSRINFSVKQEYADQVYPQDMTLVKGRTTGSYYLEFVPLYKDGSDTETMLHCSVTMDKIPTGERSKVVYIGEVRMNTKARLQLDTENLPEGEYYLDLSTSGDQPGYSANKRTKVILGELPEETLTDETPDEITARLPPEPPVSDDTTTELIVK